MPATREATVQADVVRLLRRNGLAFCHVPNGGRRAPREAWAFTRLGVSAGVPDLLIFSPTPSWPTCRGIAIELKAPTRRRSVSTAQQEWLGLLASCGWRVAVCASAREVEDVLAAAGLLTTERQPPAAPIAAGVDGAQADGAPAVVDDH